MNCETCKFWGRDYKGNKNGQKDCSQWDYTESVNLNNAEKTLSVDVYVSDDSGLNVNLFTGPKFGCVNHQPKQ